jgi:hypothetical protein
MTKQEKNKKLATKAQRNKQNLKVDSRFRGNDRENIE